MLVPVQCSCLAWFLTHNLPETLSSWGLVSPWCLSGSTVDIRIFHSSPPCVHATLPWIYISIDVTHISLRCRNMQLVSVLQVQPEVGFVWNYCCRKSHCRSEKSAPAGLTVTPKGCSVFVSAVCLLGCTAVTKVSRATDSEIQWGAVSLQSCSITCPSVWNSSTQDVCRSTEGRMQLETHFKSLDFKLYVFTLYV